MCGIIGVIGNNSVKLGTFLYEALKNLEYRGYDSVGIAFINDKKLIINKSAGKIDDLIYKLNFDGIDGEIGIGHTRWATHGPPTDYNAHPHADCTGKIAVVHNGIIYNHHLLRKELEDLGHQFLSDTDTEIVAHLIEEYMKNNSFTNAILKTVKKLSGSFAIASIYANEPDKIICIKKESPLYIGISDKALYCSSDIPTLLKYTNKIVPLEDDEIAILTKESYAIISFDGHSINRKPTIVEWGVEMSNKGMYKHFMLKEIYEEPIVIRNTLNIKVSILDKLIVDILKANHVYIIASGTSYHAALYGSYLFSRSNRIMAYPVIASEFNRYILPSLSSSDVIIAISQSGETMDVLTAIKRAKSLGAKPYGIINVIGSTLTRLVNDYIPMLAGPEIGVAATKTFISEIAILDLISARMSDIVNNYDNTFKKHLQNLINTSYVLEKILPSIDQETEILAQKIKNCESCYVLSRGLGVPLAMEGALKIKEVSYIHAESYPAGESKHGPIALVNDNFPCIFIDPPDENFDEISGNIMEMKARGAQIILIGDKNAFSDITISTPTIGDPFSDSVLRIVPLQLLAYHLAVKRGFNPDKPRNLAKSVTVF
ncbi:MAG: glutamine--fructose-6-phosphate transaminase (isomerizing) [Thermoprotei archaeon]|jgi:glucosamine--fructose-6-phosphate aminotransferase (isomerizing)